MQCRSAAHGELTPARPPAVRNKATGPSLPAPATAPRTHGRLQEGARALQARSATPPCQILDVPGADTWGGLRPRSFPLHLHTLAMSASVHTWQRRGNMQCFLSTALVQAVRCAHTRAIVLIAGATRVQGLVQAPWQQFGFRARQGAAGAAPALAADVAPVLETGGARPDAEAKPVGTILPCAARDLVGPRGRDAACVPRAAGRAPGVGSGESALAGRDGAGPAPRRAEGRAGRGGRRDARRGERRRAAGHARPGHAVRPASGTPCVLLGGDVNVVAPRVRDARGEEGGGVQHACVWLASMLSLAGSAWLA